MSLLSLSNHRKVILLVQFRMQDPEVQLATQLAAFYALHNPCNMSKAAEVAKQHIQDVGSLNQALLGKYGFDLTTLPAQVCTFSQLRPLLPLFFLPTLF